jgi:Icc-related predicted phosphoesterase
MKAFIRHTKDISDRFGHALASLDTDLKIALLHYAPARDTVVGEKPEIFGWMGSYLLGEAIDRAGADIVIHGHAHAGSFEGRTSGGVPVYNVAEAVIAKPYHVFTL